MVNKKLIVSVNLVGHYQPLHKNKTKTNEQKQTP